MKLLISIQVVVMALGAFGMVWNMATDHPRAWPGEYGSRIFAVCWCLFVAEMVGSMLWAWWQ